MNEQLQQSIDQIQENEINKSASRKIKILMCGNSYVGKTSIQRRYMHNVFTNQDVTLCMNSDRKQETIYDEIVSVNIIDIPGSQGFDSITNSAIRMADGYLLVYDICDTQSYNDILIWITKISQVRNIKEVKLMLLGNKVDSRDDNNMGIQTDKAVMLATSYSMCFLECSAKNGQNINEAIKLLASNIYLQQNKLNLNGQSNSQNITAQQLLLNSKEPNQKKTGCFEKFKDFFKTKKNAE